VIFDLARRTLSKSFPCPRSGAVVRIETPVPPVWHRMGPELHARRRTDFRAHPTTIRSARCSRLCGNRVKSRAADRTARHGAATRATTGSREMRRQRPGSAHDVPGRAAYALLDRYSTCNGDMSRRRLAAGWCAIERPGHISPPPTAHGPSLADLNMQPVTPASQGRRERSAVPPLRERLDLPSPS
jgi:hypothetical protein